MTDDEQRPKVGDLTADEQRWIVRCCLAAVEWTKSSSDLPSLAELDALAVRRMAEPENATASIDVIAVAIGEHIRRATTLTWKDITDDYGTAIGLYGEAGHIVIVPQSMVAKRWSSGEPFVESIVTQSIEHLTRIAAEYEDARTERLRN